MKSEFARKLENLASIIEARDISGASLTDNPTKFSFVFIEKDGQSELRCIWSPYLPKKLKEKVVFEQYISNEGMTSKEWTDLTKALWIYL